MGDEIELISDGDSLAIYGERSAVERFIASLEELRTAPTREISLPLSLGGAAFRAGADVAAQSGRWVKLTAESAERVKAFGLMPTKTRGVSHAMLGRPGSIKSWIQIDSSTAARLTNPTILSGAAGIMTQMAMQQQIDAIVEYLEVIDQKIDKMLRIQVDQVLSRLDGVDAALREGFAIRDAVGRVSEVAWSKVQAVTPTIHEVQGFAIRQLIALADRVEAKKIHELLELSVEAEEELKKWLLVLARCFELLDRAGILELDRVVDSSPDELDQHRLGLQAARAERARLIRDATERVLARIRSTIEAANSRVLFNPIQSPKVVLTGERILFAVFELWTLLGLEDTPETVDTRRWRDAASDGLKKVREASSTGLDAARESGGEALGSVRSAKNRLAERVAERRQRTSEPDDDIG